MRIRVAGFFTRTSLAGPMPVTARRARTRKAGAAEDLPEVFATQVDSPVGSWTLAVSRRGVVWCGREAGGSASEPSDGFVDEVVRHRGPVAWNWERRPNETAPVVDAVRRYFERDPDCFDGLPLDPAGTDFQLAVWEACARVPFGKTATYGDLALMAGRPGAARAVGGAMNRNPLPPIVPCHRILASGGGLGGYGMGGLPVKRWLLAHEAGKAVR